MIEPRFRGARTNRSLAIVWAMLAGIAMLVITLRIIQHGYAFGQWMAELSR